MPGLKAAQLILSNAEDAEHWARVGVLYGARRVHAGRAGRDGRLRRRAAEWLDDVLGYLDGNRRLLADLLAEHLPEVRYTPAGGHLPGLAGLPAARPGRARPGPSSSSGRAWRWSTGRSAGRPGAGHVRLNFATPRPVLTTIVERMAAAVRRALTRVRAPMPAARTSVDVVPAARYAFLDGPDPVAMAHRGGAIEHLENTLPAFQACVDMGYRYLETDVRVTADGVLVVFHDATLERVTDRTGRIEQPDLGRGVDGAHRRPGADPAARGPARRLARRAVQPRHQGGRRPGAAGADGPAAQGRRPHLPRLVLRRPASRRPAGCSARRSARRWARGGSPRSGCPPTPPARPAWSASRPACAQVPLQLGGRALVDERFLAAAHARGLQVHVWTVDTEEETTAMLDLGVDGVMTDRPAMLRELLEKRGQWVPR